MDLTQVFVRNLKIYQKKVGFSQKTLAERCNAAHSYIRQIESGRGHPSFAFIEKLAQALNVEPFRLFYDEMKTDNGLSEGNDNLAAIKSEFLDKVAHEFKMAIDKLMLSP